MSSPAVIEIAPPDPDPLPPPGRTTSSSATTAHLSASDVEQLGDELDAVRTRVMADLGDDDARYIRRVIAVQRGLDAGGRALLLVSILPPAWVAGTAALSVAKILENMEIGHNVLHGQWDWMNDPEIHSPSGSGIPRPPPRAGSTPTTTSTTPIRTSSAGTATSATPCSGSIPRSRGSPITCSSRSSTRGSRSDSSTGSRSTTSSSRRSSPGASRGPTRAGSWAGCGARSVVSWRRTTCAGRCCPGCRRRTTLAANLTANVVRNVWSHAVIFCGHFPAGAETFTEDQLDGETRGEWYLRQMLGSANIDGSPLLHLMTGNLSHQIEHHLFPDMPSNRYAEIAPVVRDICRRYGLPYTSGPLHRQYADVLGTILRLSLRPGRP